MPAGLVRGGGRDQLERAQRVGAGVVERHAEHVQAPANDVIGPIHQVRERDAGDPLAAHQSLRHETRPLTPEPLPVALGFATGLGVGPGPSGERGGDLVRIADQVQELCVGEEAQGGEDDRLVGREGGDPAVLAGQGQPGHGPQGPFEVLLVRRTGRGWVEEQAVRRPGEGLSEVPLAPADDVERPQLAVGPRSDVATDVTAHDGLHGAGEGHEPVRRGHGQHQRVLAEAPDERVHPAGGAAEDEHRWRRGAGIDQPTAGAPGGAPSWSGAEERTADVVERHMAGGAEGTEVGGVPRGRGRHVGPGPLGEGVEHVTPGR